MAWGLFPLFFAASGLPIGQIGVLAAVYPGVWSLGQIGSGWASDRFGRKWLIASGMWLQSGGIMLTAATGSFRWWLLGAVLMGLGTALVYPTLLAAISDVAHPSWRASSVGVYRLWRDSSYAAVAILAGGCCRLVRVRPRDRSRRHPHSYFGSRGCSEDARDIASRSRTTISLYSGTNPNK
jgi:MFS family permease